MRDRKMVSFGTRCFVIAVACTSYASANAAGVVQQVAVPPPPLGWSSWNPLGNNISQGVIEQQADALVELNKGIADAQYRYRYVNIDGGWWQTSYGDRTASGGFAIDPSLWDDGSLADTVAHIHKDHLLAGAYTDAGKTGCGGQNGSEGYYIPDMLQFAEWGFDYVKVDYCGGRAENLDPLETYTSIAQAITNAEEVSGRKFVFSVCNPGQVYATPGFPDSGEGPWSWAPGVGDLPRVIWRTSDDITGGGGLSPYATFQDVLNNFHSASHPQAEHTGYYNDPDMMVAGLPGVDADPANPLQSQAHMSLWAISGAPMIQGANLVTVQTEGSPVVGIMTNEDVIKVDQDPRGLQGIEVATPAPGVEVWSKLLAGSGQRAVVMLNTTGSAVPVTVTPSELGLDPSGGESSYDLWSHSAVAPGASGSITVTVPAQSARMLDVSGTDLASTTFQPNSNAGAGRLEFQVDPAAVPVNAKTFQFQDGINHLDIAYSNPGKTRYASLTIAGQPATTVAFPSTGSATGTVTVAAQMTTQNYNDLTFATPAGVASPSPLPNIQTVSLVAGPVPVFSPLYAAASSANTLTGTAVVQSCAACDYGDDVGFIGGGANANGTLTFNNVMAPATGQYTLLIAYANADSAPRTAGVSVNGGAPTNGVFPIAGKDYDTQGVIPLTVTLNAGSNSIKFANPTGNAPNVVAIDIKPE